ncbi:MAG: hypothetical protein ACK5XX_04065 [Holosporales bacterium]|jgi:hypothetical protein
MSETDIAVLSAIISVLGAIISGGAVITVPFWEKSRSAHFLAVRVIICLEDYARECASAMRLQDEHELDEDPYMYPIIPKEISFPTDVDWRSIDHELAFKILSLPNAARIARSQVMNIYVGEPYLECCREFSKLGIQADDIAVELRKKYKLPNKEIASEDSWNPRQSLETMYKKYHTDTPVHTPPFS